MSRTGGRQEASALGNSRTGQTVIFLHIPKTAGTTLSHIVERQYPRPQIYSIMEAPGPYRGTVDDFACLPQAQKASFRVIKGHTAFGIHRCLSRPFTYFTLLRDPTERVLSHYAHAGRDPQHNLYPYMREIPLKEALTQKLHVALAFNNFQTRLISGVWNTVPFGALDNEVLEVAKENLRRYFSVVGVVERFDESLLLLQQQFGWRDVYYTKHNRSGTRRALVRYDRETLELIRRHNRLDQELYHFAAKLCERQIERAGNRFQQRVTRFQTLNRFVRPWLRLYWQARKISLRAVVQNLIP